MHEISWSLSRRRVFRSKFNPLKLRIAQASDYDSTALRLRCYGPERSPLTGNRLRRGRHTGERSHPCGSVAPRLDRGSDAFHPRRTVFPCRRPRGRQSFGTQRIKEPRRYPRPSRSRIFLGPRFRPTLHANAVVPAIAAHRGIERGRRHPDAGNLLQLLVDLPEQRFHLSGL